VYVIHDLDEVVYVGMAGRNGKGTLRNRLRDHASGPWRPSQFSAPDGRTTQGYLMTLAIRRFAAQLLCVREIPEVNMSTVSQYYFQGAEALIWPQQPSDVSWPPTAGVLNDHLFENDMSAGTHREGGSNKSALAVPCPRPHCDR
jgi:hypothetical protein